MEKKLNKKYNFINISAYTNKYVWFSKDKFQSGKSY